LAIQGENVLVRSIVFDIAFAGMGMAFEAASNIERFKKFCSRADGGANAAVF